MTNNEVLKALDEFTNQYGVHFDIAEPEAYLSIEAALMSRPDYQIKTCVNCKHYISALWNDTNPFHIHNYCEVWNAEIPAYFIADKNNDKYDDIENCIACCWCWESKK